MEKTLKKDDFARWAAGLSSYAIYAPVKHGEQWRYEAAEGAPNLEPGYTRAAESPKRIIFPQREVLLKFSAGLDGVRVTEVLPEGRPLVVLGVRPCDAKAMTLLDKVFGGDIDDPYYRTRRRQAALVGLACGTPPSPDCFCTSVGGSPFSRDGLDVLMADLGDRYWVESLTPRGGQLLQRGGILRPAAREDSKAFENLRAESEKLFKRAVRAAEGLPARLKPMYESRFWDTESLRCIRCGICTYLCPACHCFDVNDEVCSSVPLAGERVRTWDTCQFPDFTMHSSGHNPRPDRASRLRQRVLHKFLYFVERHGAFQCTGCGRCVTACPVGIDITEVLDKAGEHE